MGADLSNQLVAAGRASHAGIVLPMGLAELLSDPTPLLDALANQPRTLLHGDAWHGNLVWRSNRPYWIDWEECCYGPAVADMATWLYGSPFVPPTPTPQRDLAAYGPVNRRALHAAFLLLFLTLDMPVLSEIPDAPRVLADRAERARRWLSGRTGLIQFAAGPLGLSTVAQVDRVVNEGAAVRSATGGRRRLGSGGRPTAGRVGRP